MIRLPATTIILGRNDLLDYEEHQQARGSDGKSVSETDKRNERLTRFTVRSQSGLIDLSQGTIPQSSIQEHRELHKEDRVTESWRPNVLSAPAVEGPDIIDGYEPEPPSEESTYPREDLSTASFQSEEPSFVSTAFEHAPENANHETSRPVSPSKHDFYYGGFIEIDSPSLTDNAPQS